VLILRCANGVVAWIFTRTDPNTVTATCEADKVTATLSRSADSTWVVAFRIIAAHSAALQGAILDALFIPDQF